MSNKYEIIREYLDENQSSMSKSYHDSQTVTGLCSVLDEYFKEVGDV